MASLSVYLQAVISLSVGALVIAWLWYQWTHRRRLALARKLPVVLPTLPLIGHLHYFLHIRNGLKESVKVLLQQMNAKSEHGLSCFWVGPVPWVLVYRPDVIQAVLNSSKALEKPSEFSVLKCCLGDGLVTAPVHFWKKTRRQINQVFHTRNVQLLVPLFNTESARVVQNMSELVGTSQRDVLPYLSALSLANVFGLVYGTDVQFDRGSDNFRLLIQNIDRIATVVAKRLYTFWLQCDDLFHLLYKELLASIDSSWDNLLKKLLDQTMERKRRPAESDGDSEWNSVNADNFNKDDSQPQVLTLTDVFLRLQQSDSSFQEHYQRSEINTIITTGMETTALTLSSCLVVLGSHLHIQEKLYQEVVDVVGTSPGQVSLDDINRMTYMDQVLKETLRRFAVLPSSGRRITDDIKIGKFTIPANTPVMVSIASVHHNPEIYPDPFRFDPDRFTPESVSKREKYSYLPFSGGPRDCVGKHYAMIAMKIALTHILREFKIHSDVDINKMRFYYKITIACADGYHVKLQRRTDKQNLQI